MTTKTVLAAVIAGAIVLGCSSAPPVGKTQAKCQQQHCSVDISVTVDGQVVFAPDVLEIQGNKDVHILWKLPPGYEFVAGDGVFFKRDKDNQFYDPYATSNDNGDPGSNKTTGKNFHWRDKNTVLGPFDYGIRFHERSSGKEHFKDPTILNDG